MNKSAKNCNRNIEDNSNDGWASGYTLIEVVITMFITATVFVGVYALFAKAMKYDTEGRYEIVASELAQEGIEMIKNKKEKNEMDWAVWDPSSGDDVENLTTFKNIKATCNPSLSWGDDGTGYNFSCTTPNNVQYNKDESIKKFIAGCSGDTCVGPKFTRKCSTRAVHVRPDDGITDELEVHCEVSWQSSLLNGGERTVKAGLVLTDWER